MVEHPPILDYAISRPALRLSQLSVVSLALGIVGWPVALYLATYASSESGSIMIFSIVLLAILIAQGCIILHVELVEPRLRGIQMAWVGATLTIIWPIAFGSLVILGFLAMAVASLFRP